MHCSGYQDQTNLDRFAYCIKVYLQSLMEGNSSGTNQSSGLPSYNGSIRTASARQAYRRVRRVVELQWRGILIVVVILADVVFFSVVFVYLDNTTQESQRNIVKAEPWLLCLILHDGDKNKCLDLAAQLAVTEATVMAVLILLAVSSMRLLHSFNSTDIFQQLNGVWCIVLLGRWSMVTGWVEFIQQRFQRKREFVSVDARRFSNDPRTYEMLKSPPQPDVKEPEPVASPDGLGSAVMTPNRKGEDLDYFGKEVQYSSPHLSFSSPRATAWNVGRDWDPHATHARSMMSSPGVDDNKI